jgi:hypothetical protein
MILYARPHGKFVGFLFRAAALAALAALITSAAHLRLCGTETHGSPTPPEPPARSTSAHLSPAARHAFARPYNGQILDLHVA